MSIVRIIGCLHLGHESMAKYRGFEGSYLHDTYMRKQWNKIVKKKDLTYILGDITMENSNNYYLLDELNGRKVVVLGNHDMCKNVRELLNHVENVAGMIDYKGFTLTHAPIHPSEIGHYRGNIHAHIHHKNKLVDFDVNKKYNNLEDNPVISTKGKYFNVDAHLLDYTPKTIEELIKQKDLL